MLGFGNVDRTHVTMVLDRSGSMQSVYQPTVDGFQAFVEKQQKIPGDCRMTLVQFDTIYETVFRNRPIGRVGPLDLRPRGGTALLDAMGRAIQDTARATAQAWRAFRPNRVIVVTITDGLENSSREFTRAQVFDLVRRHTDQHDWQFVFLGANQDAIREAARCGIAEDAAMTYHAGLRGTQNAWSAVGEAVARHRGLGTPKVAGSYFTEAERASARDLD